MLLKYLLVPLLLFNTTATPVSELLLNKKWVLTSYGFDENGNNHVDMMEERIEECEKDDTYQFYSNGKGIMSDNSFSCCNGIDEQVFQWRFTDKGQSLLVSSETIHIMRLTTRELVTYKKLSYTKGQALKLITVYRTME